MVWCCDPLEPILSEFETIEVDELDKHSVVSTAPSSELIVSGTWQWNTCCRVFVSLFLPIHMELICAETVFFFFLFFCCKVTIPAGVNENEALTVRSPDGKDMVTAIVPMGLSEGDTFLVRFPSKASTSLPIADGVRNERVQPESHEENDIIDYECMSSRGDSNTNSSPELDADIEPLSDEGSLVDADKPSGSTQKLLLVQVPAGVRPGSTIHVEIPGEFRTVAAMVPAGVTSFHVAYTPTVTSKEESQSPYLPSDLPKDSPSRTSTPPQQAPSTLVNKSTPTGQKLLLVQIPPGATAGTILHVSVPDEPGRILAAKVPMGCVSEFHVAYEARPSAQNRSMLAPASAYNPQQSRRQLVASEADRHGGLQP